MNLRIADFTTTTEMRVALVHLLLRPPPPRQTVARQDILTSWEVVSVATTSFSILTRHLPNARCCARLKQAVWDLSLVCLTAVVAVTNQTTASCRMGQTMEVATAITITLTSI